MIDRFISLINPPENFQDRGIAKWAGFFYPSTQLALHTKKLTAVSSWFFHLLNRSGSWSRPFNNKRRSRITTLEGNQFATYRGSIHTLSASEVLLKSDGHYHRLLVDSIIFIESEGNSLWNLFKLNTNYNLIIFRRITTNLRQTFTSGPLLLRRSSFRRRYSPLYGSQRNYFVFTILKVGIIETIISILRFPHLPITTDPYLRLYRTSLTKIVPRSNREKKDSLI